MIAIHHRPGSFSDRWIEYCRANDVRFKVVDCHRSDIIEQLLGCRALMWNFSQAYIQDMLIAHAIVKSAQAMGVRVFPDTSTSWHFDDKVAQKYFLEALRIPSVPSYVFVNRESALKWAQEVGYPKVFKLKTGAGSSNVSLVGSAQEASKLIKRAFANGFPPVPRWNALRERWWHLMRDRDIDALVQISRGLGRGIRPNPTLRRLPWQKQYAYFQDFIAKNDSDVRIIVIGHRAFGIRRMVRQGDFRASGSGAIIHDPAVIPLECVELAFRTAKAASAQSLALDFVFDNGKPLVVEMSYAFTSAGYWNCPGYWRRDGSWIEGRFRAEDFMLEDLLSSLDEKNA